MRVYIAGAITGVKNYELTFKQREKELKSMGYQVENPVAIGQALQRMFPYDNLTHADYMNQTLKALLNCEGISMLNGWENSEGARIEYEVAKATNKIFVEIKPLENRWNSEGR